MNSNFSQINPNEKGYNELTHCWQGTGGQKDLYVKANIEPETHKKESFAHIFWTRSVPTTHPQKYGKNGQISHNPLCFDTPPNHDY